MSLKLSNTATTITLMVSTFGTGILLMPTVFRKLGYVAGIAAIVFVAALNYFTLYSLAYSAHSMEVPRTASFTLIANTISPLLKNAADIAMIGSNLGNVFYTLKAFLDTTESLAINVFGMDATHGINFMRIVLVVLLSALFFFFIQEDLSALSFISNIVVVSVVYYLGLVIYFALGHGVEFDSLTKFDKDGIDSVVNIVFALHAQFAYLSIFTSMKSNKMADVKKTLSIATSLLVVVYSFSGFFGYWATGKVMNDNFIKFLNSDDAKPLGFYQSMMNLPMDNKGILRTILNVGFLVVWFGGLIFATAPIITIVSSWVSVGKAKVDRKIVSFGMCLFYLAMGIFLTSGKAQIDSILTVFAAIFTNSLSYVFPSIFMMYVSRRGSANYLISGFAILFSLLFGGFVIKNLITEIQKKSNAKID
ncbi:hypothetical protein ENBRE01_0086 [Enteropsectra breve]|nr:hypothetical protein ENBRE01_0086 [Enteropsectra breve]